MRTDRLESLASFLETPDLPYAHSDWVTQLGSLAVQGLRPTWNCGTVACAMGWTPAVFPEVQYALSLWGTFDGWIFEGKEYYSGMVLAMNLFEITQLDAEKIFYGSDDKSAKDVALEIRRLIENGNC